MNRDQLCNRLDSLEVVSVGEMPQLVADIMFVAGSCPDDIGATSWALLKIAEATTKTREVECLAKLPHYQALLRYVVSTSVKYVFSAGADSLRLVFDSAAEFYKHNLHDKNVEFPLTRERPLDLYFPVAGEECDVVRPGLTTTSKMGWTRCKVLSINNSGVYTVRFFNTAESVVLTDGSWFAPLATRTQDFEWRQSLKIGDMLDALDSKLVWILSTVSQVSVDQHGHKNVRVTFRQFTPTGDRTDSQGLAFFGWGSNQDQWMDITTPRIQKAYKMKKELCYYASTQHNEFYMDDNYDIVYQKEYNLKPFVAMLRSSFTRSQAIYSLFNFFVDEGGMHNALRNLTEKTPIDVVCNMAVVIGLVVFMPPRMAVRALFGQYLYKFVDYIKDNFKSMNNQRMDLCLWGIQNIGKRLLTLCQKHDLIQSLKKFLIPKFLTRNLEKQLLGLRYIYDLIRPVRPASEESKSQLLQFVNRDNLFYLVYQQNESHEQVLTRSTQFLEYTLKNELTTVDDLGYLWNLFPLNDARGRVTLQKLIGDVMHQMKADHILYLLDRLLEIQPSDLTMDNLQLLHNMKSKKKLQGHSYVRALELLWQLLTVKSATVKSAVQQQVQRIFKSFITNIQDQRVKFQLLNSMVSCLKQAKNVQKEPSLLREYLLTYKTEGVDGIYPVTRQAVIAFLCQHDIYQVLLRLLASTKADHKIQDILDLLSQILRNDKENQLPGIAREVYRILGPSQIMLKWTSQLSQYLQVFIEEVLVSTTDFGPFENMTLNGLNALTSMFNDINSVYGKRRFVKDKMEIDNIVEIQWNSFVYTSCNPDDLVGLEFMKQLLRTVKHSLVYAKIIEFIVKLYVNLDQKLIDQAETIRKAFLLRIVSQFQQIDSLLEYNDSTKLRFTEALNTLGEFIEQTEVEGLRGVVPYFQTLLGENMNLKIENSVAGTKKPKEIEIFVMDNITLEQLRKYISQKLEQAPSDITLLRGKKVFEEKFNGKSLQELRITKGDVVRVEKSKIPQALKVPLLTQDKTSLSPKMQSVAARIYSLYADLQNGTVMSVSNCVKMTADIAKANGKEDESKKLLEKNNEDNKKVKCTQQEVNKLFVDMASTSQSTVWKFVQSLGIQQDLRIDYQQSAKKLPTTSLPRSILSDQNTYDILLSMLRNQKLQPHHLDIYKLLCSLPTDARLKQNIFGDWSSKSFNRSMSVFQVDYMLGLLQVQLERNEEFCLNFGRTGLYTLVQYIKQYKLEDNSNSVYSLKGMEKTVVSSIVRIFTGFTRISLQPNALVTRLYYQKVNQLDLCNIVQLSNNKMEVNQHDIEFKAKFQRSGISVPVQQISGICSSLLTNLVFNYTDSYIKELCPEVARLCAMLTSFYPHDIKGLLEGIRIDSINLRRTCTNLLYLQAAFLSQRLGLILDEVLLNIPKENKNTAIQYFQLLSKLILLSTQRKVNTVDLKRLTEELINKVLAYNSDEKRGSIIIDRIINGLLSVVEIIVSSQPDVAASLASYKWKLLDRCLFYPDPAQNLREVSIPQDILNEPNQPELLDHYINAKSVFTRKTLINIIIQLAKHGQNQPADFLEAVLEPILRQIPQKPRKPNSKNLTVGILNLGGICYFNSMIQSLNSVSAFRNGISMVQKQDSKLITSTQRMLAYLLFSQRQDFVPTPVLEAFRDPINPNIQQDTTQFLNLYFDQLQGQLQTTPYRHLLKQLFQGSTVGQMICRDCGNKRQRKQQYFCYSVAVRDKPTLELALEGMHQGDIINDYNCQACQKKSDLIKRSVLGDLPNFMFLHLQRIVNLDFYKYTKIHSKCLFPFELNIQPFTKEGVELRQTVGVEYLKKLEQNEEETNKFKEQAKHGKPDKYYTYNLKSIIVHSGSAEGGHYYVIMKKEGGGWLKLDDSKTTSFSLEQFETECYGGPFQVIGEWGIQESKNAYVLLYQKQLKSDIILDFEDLPNEALKFGTDLESLKKGIDYSKFKTYNSPDLYKEVWLDNHKLMLESHIFGEGYNKDFIRLIQGLLESSNSPKKAELISEVFLKISCWSNEIGNLMDQFQKLNPGYSIFLKYAKDYDCMFNLMFHGQKSIRCATAKFLSTLIMNSIREGPAEEVYKLMDFFLSRLNSEVAKNWLRVDSYFNFLHQIVTRSVEHHELYRYVIEKHLISLLIDFILEKESPLKLGIKKHSMGNKFNNVDFGMGVKVIYWLFLRSHFFNGQNDINDEEAFHLSDNDVLSLSCMGFYTKMVRQRQAVTEVSQIIAKLAVDNYGFVQAISRTLLRVVNDSMQRIEQTKAVVVCIQKLMLVDDSLWKKKAEMILGLGQPYQINRDNTFCSLDIDRFTYNSTLEDIFPIECVFNLAWMSRHRYPLVTLHVLNSLLKIALARESNFEYIVIQPPPTYMYKRYHDWWQQFVVFAVNTIPSDKSKQEQLNKLNLETTTLMSTFKAKIDLLDIQEVITGKVVGSTKSTILNPEIGLSIVIQDIMVYSIPSLPSADHQSNGALSKYLTKNRLEDENDSIEAESNILKFMTTSQPLLAITQDKLETCSNKAETSEVMQGDPGFIGPKNQNYTVFFDYDAATDNLLNSKNEKELVVMEQQFVAEAPSQSTGKQMVIEEEQQAKETKREPQYRRIDIDSNIACIEYYRKVVVNNLTDQNVLVRMTVQNVDYMKSNCLIPHFCSKTILSHKDETMMSLYKLDIHKQFQLFQYNVTVQSSSKYKKRVVPPAFFKLYGYPHVESNSQMQLEEAPEPPTNMEDSIKVCSACTFSNAAGSQKCELCEAPFF